MPSAAHTVTEVLSPDEIERRFEMLKQGLDPDAEELHSDPVVADELFVSEGGLYVPWVAAADEYIAWSQTPQRRVYTGIDEFDQVIRGVGDRELMLVVGYAHSGKTVFTTQMLLHNHHRRVCVFTPDETRVLVLVKMASILHGVSAEEIEERLAGGDPDAEDLLRSVATDHFPHFAVFDEITDLHWMDRAVDECEQRWGDRCELIVIDYLDLVTGVGEDVRGIANAVKAWGKKRDAPIVLLHQASRSSGADGKKMSISSGGYGGEQQATFVIGVRRKRQQYDSIIEELEQRRKLSSQESTIARIDELIEEARYEARIHRNTITFSLVKNKRPPSRLVDDTDFILDSETGRVRRYHGEAAHAAVYNEPAYEQPEVF